MIDIFVYAHAGAQVRSARREPDHPVAVQIGECLWLYLPRDVAARLRDEVGHQLATQNGGGTS
ncbi:MAG TPA: hypothetical protein VHH34_18220 [Pseudonocardiaceae bacterium]|nr:hypothetical protein [Pseudonocardiaceae bacterium]